MSQDLSDASCVEKVSTLELHVWLVTECFTADVAAVILVNLFFASALWLEAGRVFFLSFAAAALMSTRELLSARTYLGKWLKGGHLSLSAEHHVNQIVLVLILLSDVVFSPEFDHFVYSCLFLVWDFYGCFCL